MNSFQPIDRRTFITDLGRGAFGLAVVTIVGCIPSGAATPSASRVAGTPGGSSPSAGGSPSPAETAGSSSGAPPSGATGGVTWERVNLGFVSAYILARAGEAAIVDTGVEDSADAIESSLSAAGLDWSAVAHLILTHQHGDHVGSAADVLERAPDAIGHAGAEDIPAISVPRELTAVSDGDEVFGLRIVTTPGHTAGSISVLDEAGGLLVAGDALTTEGGAPGLPDAQFTANMAQAKESVIKLGGTTFETLLVGHGDPVEGGASAMVAELGAAG